MIDIFKISHASIVVPNFATSPRAHVEDVIESRFDDASVTDGEYSFVKMAFNQFFDEKTNSGSKMDEGLAIFDERCNWGKRPLAGPVFGIF